MSDISGVNWILWGGALLVLVLLVRLVWRAGQVALAPAQRKPRRVWVPTSHTPPATKSDRASINALEARLQDFASDVENRVETQLQLLDELIQDADREIERLQKLMPELDWQADADTTANETGDWVEQMTEDDTIGEHRATSLRPDFDAIRRHRMRLDGKRGHGSADAA